MIRNIPNKYKLNSLLEEINANFNDKYDLFYLPVDHSNNCNLGFAFINFIDPFHIIAFNDYFKGKKWKCFNSEKVKINNNNYRFVNLHMQNIKERKNCKITLRRVLLLLITVKIAEEI